MKNKNASSSVVNDISSTISLLMFSRLSRFKFICVFDELYTATNHNDKPIQEKKILKTEICDPKK